MKDLMRQHSRRWMKRICSALLISGITVSSWTSAQAAAEPVVTVRQKTQLISDFECPGSVFTSFSEYISVIRDRMKVMEYTWDVCPYIINSQINKPVQIAQDGDLNQEFYEMENMKFDPYRVRSASEVECMLNYAKWWRDKGIRYGTSWVSKDSKYYDPTKSFHQLKIGGRSDCSWFVYNILRKFGYVNHFISSTKWGEDSKQYPGAHVVKGDISKASPGDIICSGKAKLGSAHVAIYVGDGYVIECTFSGVKLTKCSKNPRRIVHFDCNPAG